MRKLTEAQKDMLRLALDRGTMTSGRYGWNTMWVKALEKKGLVRLERKYTREAVWRLTEAGMAAAEAAMAEWKADLKATGLQDGEVENYRRSLTRNAE
jgi:DNA-binding MarR family transcriptional regulator